VFFVQLFDFGEYTGMIIAECRSWLCQRFFAKQQQGKKYRHRRLEKER
jgi:hypothetical protein